MLLEYDSVTEYLVNENENYCNEEGEKTESKREKNYTITCSRL